MERYYASRPWLPVEADALLSSTEKVIDGSRFIEVTVGIVPGVIPDTTATLVFEETADGLLLDWELLSDTPTWDWDRLLAEKPETPEVYRVALKRSSLPDSVFAAFGIDPAEGLGFRMWARDQEASVFAVLPADDPLAQRLVDDATWEVGRHMMVELAWAGSRGGDDYVTISRHVNDGWVTR